MRISLLLLSLAVGSTECMDDKKVMVDPIKALSLPFKSHKKDSLLDKVASRIPKLGQKLSKEDSKTLGNVLLQKNQWKTVAKTPKSELQKKKKAMFLAGKVLEQAGSMTKSQENAMNSVEDWFVKDDEQKQEKKALTLVDSYIVESCKIDRTYDSKTPMYEQFHSFYETSKKHRVDLEKEQVALQPDVTKKEQIVSGLENDISMLAQSLYEKLQLHKNSSKELGEKQTRLMFVTLALLGARVDEKNNFESLKDCKDSLAKDLQEAKDKVAKLEAIVKDAKEGEKEEKQKELDQAKIALANTLRNHDDCLYKFDVLTRAKLSVATRSGLGYYKHKDDQFDKDGKLVEKK